MTSQNMIFEMETLIKKVQASNEMWKTIIHKNLTIHKTKKYRVGRNSIKSSLEIEHRKPFEQ